MDLLNIYSIILYGNIVILFLFFIPGTVLESIEDKNNNNSRKVIRSSLQLNLKVVNSMDAVRKLSSTEAPFYTAAINTILLPSLTTEKVTAATTKITVESMKLLSTETNTKNNSAAKNSNKYQQQDNHYKRINKIRRNLKLTSDKYYEIFKGNITASSIARRPINEQLKQKQQTKSFTVPATDFSYMKNVGQVEDYHRTNAFDNTTKSLSILKNTSKLHSEILTNVNYTEENNENLLGATLSSNPFKYFRKDQQQHHNLEHQLTTSNPNINVLYVTDSGISHKNNDYSIREVNDYEDSGQIAPTPTITINSSNKSKHAASINTTAMTITTMTTRKNHMYDDNNVLSHLTSKSAALKAFAPAMKTSNNNFNVFGNGGVGGSSLKRDTLMSSAGIILEALADVGNNSIMKYSTHSHVQANSLDEKNVSKTLSNFKSNNSLAHETLAIKQTSQVTITTTSIRSAINETTSSLPLNVSTTTHFVKPTASTKEIPTIGISRTTLKSSTARRRKIPTTTLKPPPTIDDYQTITSQAGTHAYLPCNVKQLVKKPISWLRVRDGHILTVDQTTFIADQRFQSIFTTNPERWSLQIKYVQLKDAGIYECQVSTEPKASAIVYLHVVEPKTELIGAPTRHVKAGSQVKLLCIISQALEPPLFINWFYNQKQIYLHNRKGWHTEIERIELPPDTTTTTTTTNTPTTISRIKTTTITTTPLTTTTTGSTSSYTTLSSTSLSMLKGSKIPAMHVFTSITPQQSLNDDNLLELVSESTYSSYYPNLKQPILTTLKTQQQQQQQQAQTTSTTTMAATSSVATTGTATIMSSKSMAKVGVVSSITTKTQPAAFPSTTTTPTTTSLNDNDYNDNDDDADDDYQTNLPATTFETAEAIASGRGYIMLSPLMTVADVKQITTASLIIPSVQKQDSGNYTCSPSNSEPRTIILHVLNGEYSASAITSTAALNLGIPCNFLLINLLVPILINNVLIKALPYTQHAIKRYSGG